MLSGKFAPGPTASSWRYDPNLQFLNAALEIARREKDVFALRERLYARLEWGHPFSEATHTLVVPLAMFVAADGDFCQTVVGCVMYGRDHDSYASIAGALAGAFQGTDAIPPEWIQPVIDGNPEVNMPTLALEMTKLLVAQRQQIRDSADALEAMLRAHGP